MKALIENAVASLVSAGVNRLHNRDTPDLSREEIRYLRLSFSQFGEDLSLVRLFDEHFPMKNGVYVDAGAFHPIHLSTTLLLHKRGWRGVNIDMNAEKIARFNALRPGDVNVHAAVNKTPGMATSSQEGVLEHMIADPNGSIPVRTLDDILAETPFRKIDYLNIDCEGHDYDVLQSISLEIYEPKVITVEAWGLEEFSRLKEYLEPRGYTFAEKFHFTLLFIRREGNGSNNLA